MCHAFFVCPDLGREDPAYKQPRVMGAGNMVSALKILHGPAQSFTSLYATYLSSHLFPIQPLQEDLRNTASKMQETNRVMRSKLTQSL